MVMGEALCVLQTIIYELMVEGRRASYPIECVNIQLRLFHEADNPQRREQHGKIRA